MRTLRNVKRRSCSCCLLFVLGFLALVGGLAILLTRVVSAAPGSGYDIVLVSDQSPSMWECDGGPGSDPELLRLDAIRLFIHYLGSDSSAQYRLGLVQFGGTAEMLAPLTDLSYEAARQQLAAAISDPEPVRWTNPSRALQTARKMLDEEGLPGNQRMIVLLTDGEPTWPSRAGMDQETYQRDLRGIASELAASDTSLMIVLLANPASTCSQRVTEGWLDTWKDITEMTPGGNLHPATRAEDLMPAYHAIVRRLLGVPDSDLLDDTALESTDEPLRIPVPVDEELASMILVIWKQYPATTAQILGPGGQPLDPQADQGLLASPLAGQHREEVWRIERPAMGTWWVLLSGEGRVTVWQDRLPLPAPTSTPTAPFTGTPAATATVTAAPAHAPSPTRGPPPTRTPTPAALPTPAPTATSVRAIAMVTPIRPMRQEHAPLSVAPKGTDSRRPGGWLLAGAGLAVTVAGAVGGWAILQRRHINYLSGQLVPVSGPGGVLLPLPLDLGRQHAQQMELGQGATDAEWRLEGWSGTMRLAAAGQATVTVESEEEELTVNGNPIFFPTVLGDGDIIAAGQYQIRYENLLCACSGENSQHLEGGTAYHS